MPAGPLTEPPFGSCTIEVPVTRSGLIQLRCLYSLERGLERTPVAHGHASAAKVAGPIIPSSARPFEV